MGRLDRARLWTTLAGERGVRGPFVAAVLGVLAVASVAFLAGLNVGLYDFGGWVVFVTVLPVVGGVVAAGLAPTIGSLWLVGAWGYVFPPLVGYLTGEWTPTGRYAYPRLQGYAHASARGELLGAVDQALNFGLLVAVVLGTVGYTVGVTARRLANRVRTER